MLKQFITLHIYHNRLPLKTLAKKLSVFSIFLISFYAIQHKASAKENLENSFTVFYHKDNSSSLDIENIIPVNWTKSETKNLNFGIDSSTFWVKIKINQNVNSDLYLSVKRSIWDSLNFYFYDKNNKLHSSKFGYQEKKEILQNLNFPYIKITPNAIKNGEIYIKGSNRYPVIFPISLSNESHFNATFLFNTIFQSILIVGLLIMAVYNLFLWFMIRERTYYIYTLNLLITALIQVSLNGYLSYFNIVSLETSFFSVRTLIPINLILSSLFTLHLIPNLLHHKLYKNIIYSFMIIGVLSIIMDRLGHYYSAIKLLMLTSFLIAFCFIIIGYVFWIKKQEKVAMFYSISWTMYLVALIIYILKSNGTIVHNWLTDNFVHLSKFFETSLLSFAIGFRYNQLKREKAALQIKLNNELESLVKEKTLSLNNALQAKEVLFNEVHHRVKNNLQMINSMLAIQRRRFPEQVKHLILTVQNRIKAISIVHEQLYADNLYTSVYIKDYIKKLLSSLKVNNVKGTDNIKFELQTPTDIIIPMKTAIAFGIIVNEVVSNSIKHAQPNEKQLSITISIQKKKNELTVILFDNGKESILNTSTTQKGGLGMNIVADMARQLNATFQLNKKNGYQYTFLIPLHN